MKTINEQYNVLIESRLTRLETIAESQTRILERNDQKFERLESKIDSHFRWTIGLILASFFLPFVNAILKANGWL